MSHVLRNGLFVGLLLASVTSLAVGGLSYEGQIIKPDGTPLSGHTAQFDIQIRSPVNDCLLYEETQTQDLSSTNGNYAFTIGDGSGAASNSNAYALDRVFSNFGVLDLATGACASGSTYAPSANDGRVLVLKFKDETMGNWETVPGEKINFSPLAFEAKQVQGFTADSLLRVVSGTSPATGLSPLSMSQYNALMGLVNVTSTTYTPSGTLNGAPLPTMSAGQALGWNGTTWASVPVASPGVTSLTVGSGLSSSNGNPITSTSTLSLANSGVTAGNYGSSFQIPVLSVDAFGRVTSASNQTFNAGNAPSFIATGASSASSPAFGFSNSMAGVYSPLANTVAVSTNNIERVRVTDGGLVGIGTSTPTAALDVMGPMKTSISASSVQPILTLNNLASNSGSGTAIQFTSNGLLTGLITSQVPSTNSGLLSFATTLSGAPSERMRIDATGYVGIGTTSPRAVLDVGGAIVSRGFSGTATFDFAQGNVAQTAASCGTMTLNNLKDGGIYRLVVKGTTSATCTFTAYSDSGATALNVHTSPTSGVTTVSKHTLFEITVAGSDVYIYQINGF